MTIEVALLVVVTGTRVVVLNDDGGRPLSDSDDRDAGVRRDDKDNGERDAEQEGLVVGPDDGDGAEQVDRVD